MLLIRISALPGSSGRSTIEANDEDVTLTITAEGRPSDSHYGGVFRSHRILLSPDMRPEDSLLFGRHGLLELSQDSASSPCLYITGGKSAEQNKSLDGMLRVSAADHRTLIRMVAQHDRIQAEVLSTAVPYTPAPQANSDDAQPLHRLRAYLSAASLVAAPFLLPRASEAQCVSPGSGNYDSGSNYSGVDFSHITVDEGGSALNGYVPTNSSGVTIAGGLDLGVHTASDLSNIGLSQSLITQFQPFLATGPGQYTTGAAARAALQANPGAATIDAPTAASINQTVYNYYTTNVATAFNNASPNMMFTDLNVQWQTVISSMYLQSQNIPNTQFFTQVANGQWSAALANLQNFGGPSSAQNNRAKREADYLNNSGCTTGTN